MPNLFGRDIPDTIVLPDPEDTVEGPLLLKALSLRADNTFGSANRRGAVWDHNGELNAFCFMGHSAPDENCTCGIYGTLDFKLGERYQKLSPDTNAIVLFECRGRFIFHENGVGRCYQAVVRAVVDFLPAG